jgi:hypothetical protein
VAGLHRPHGRRLTSERSWSARLAGKSSRDAVVPVVTLSLSWSGACRAGQSCRLPRTHRGVRTAHVPADLWERCMWWAQSSCSNVPRGRRPDARGAALRHRAAAPSRRRTGLLRSPLAYSTPDTAGGCDPTGPPGSHFDPRERPMPRPEQVDSRSCRGRCERRGESASAEASDGGRVQRARRELQPRMPVTSSIASPRVKPCRSMVNWCTFLVWSLLRILTMFSARPVLEFSSM